MASLLRRPVPGLLIWPSMKGLAMSTTHSIIGAVIVFGAGACPWTRVNPVGRPSRYRRQLGSSRRTLIGLLFAFSAGSGVHERAQADSGLSGRQAVQECQALLLSIMFAVGVLR